MPYPLTLPQASPTSFTHFVHSVSHPSLPLSATTSRNALCSLLKNYHASEQAQRASSLTSIITTAEAYIPYLLALIGAPLSKPGSENQALNVVPIREFESTWRSYLISSRLPGKQFRKVVVKSLAAEIAFTLITLANAFYLCARDYLRGVYENDQGLSASAQSRSASVTSAMKALLSANSVYNYLSSFVLGEENYNGPLEVSSSMATALASLAISEATLLAVHKDDGFANVLIAQRNANDTDWMVAAPVIPKVRAQLLSRICIASADHASHGAAATSVGTQVLDGDCNDSKGLPLETYLIDLQQVARAKSCRFAAIDAEAAGENGTAIGWLHAALVLLNFKEPDRQLEGRSSGKIATNLKTAWKRKYGEKLEDKLISRHGDWGKDAGSMEEARITEMLLHKWERINNTVHFQAVADPRLLLRTLPAGREFHSIKTWSPPELDRRTLKATQAPLDLERERQVIEAVQTNQDMAHLSQQAADREGLDLCF